MAQLIVITNPDLAPGFRLAGVETYVAETPEEARKWLVELLDSGEAGVVAMDEAYLATLDPPTRRRIEQAYRPVVIGVPAGTAGESQAQRRRRLAELIRRAIGVRITFRGAE